MLTGFGLAKLKSEGTVTSYDDVVHDIDLILERRLTKSGTRRYSRKVENALRAAKTEIESLRKAQ